MIKAAIFDFDGLILDTETGAWLISYGFDGSGAKEEGLQVFM